MTQQAPALSIGERDRRWQCVRGLMREHGLDFLLVGGFRGREHYESYITDDYIEGLVVMPLEGEPTALTWTGSRITRARESYSRGIEPWVTDYRVGVNPALVASIVREKGSDLARFGVVGLESMAPGETSGIIPYPFWNGLIGEFPQATFKELSREFGKLMLVKSEEELALVRYAAQIAEKASEAMLAVTRPGVGEEFIYAEIMRQIFLHAADARYPTLNLHSGPHNLSWGPPRWISRAEHPRRLEKGDMVQAEIFPCYGNQEVQAQMSIALDPISETNQRCEKVARRSYEEGLKVLRPGLKFTELVRAMEEPLRESGCWAKTPLVHSLGPGGGVGQTSINMQQLDGTPEGRVEAKSSPRKGVRGDFLIESGMVFAFEPNACLDTHRVNIGGTVVVTNAGCEELNVMATRVQHVF